MNYQQATQYLNSFVNFESKLHEVDRCDFSLDGLRRFLSLIGDPQDQLEYVHIAGSKGKGSTAVLTAEVLRKNGYRVGLYTSPHLYDVRERMRILSLENQLQAEGLFGDEIAQDDFTQLISRLKEVVESGFNGKLTYFEMLTALAFLYFKESNVDIVVLETGLGGRLDATNIIEPLVCGITLIDLEHTGILGNTIEEIASEKAGIIKPGCLGVISADQAEEAEVVIRGKCGVCGVRGIFIGNDIKINDLDCGKEGLKCCVVSSDGIHDVETQLLGKFQAANIAMTIGIVELLSKNGFNISKGAMMSAFKDVFWPGRMEVVARKPCVVIDSAHTEKSSRWLIESMAESFPGKNVVLILGMSSDKDKYAVATNFSEIVSKVILTKTSHERADDFLDDRLQKIFQRKNIECVFLPIKDAVKEIFNNKESPDVFLAAGSIFLAAEIRSRIKD